MRKTPRQGAAPSPLDEHALQHVHHPRRLSHGSREARAGHTQAGPAWRDKDKEMETEKGAAVSPGTPPPARPERGGSEGCAPPDPARPRPRPARTLRRARPRRSGRARTAQAPGLASPRGCEGRAGGSWRHGAAPGERRGRRKVAGGGGQYRLYLIYEHPYFQHNRLLNALNIGSGVG